MGFIDGVVHRVKERKLGCYVNGICIGVLHYDMWLLAAILSRRYKNFCMYMSVKFIRCTCQSILRSLLVCALAQNLMMLNAPTLSRQKEIN